MWAGRCGSRGPARGLPAKGCWPRSAPPRRHRAAPAHPQSRPAGRGRRTGARATAVRRERQTRTGAHSGTSRWTSRQGHEAPLDADRPSRRTRCLLTKPSHRDADHVTDMVPVPLTGPAVLARPAGAAAAQRPHRPAATGQPRVRRSVGDRAGVPEARPSRRSNIPTRISPEAGVASLSASIPSVGRRPPRPIPLRTGHPLDPPVSRPVPVYPVRAEDGCVYVLTEPREVG